MGVGEMKKSKKNPMLTRLKQDDSNHSSEYSFVLRIQMFIHTPSSIVVALGITGYPKFLQ